MLECEVNMNAFAGDGSLMAKRLAGKILNPVKELWNLKY